MLVAAVIMFKLLNWMPLSVGHEDVRRYKTIEDVKTSLKIKEVYLPSYFPQRLKWPASEIYAQISPFSLVLTDFRDRERGDIVLAIRQADVRDPAPLKTRIEPERIKRRESIVIKGRPAQLSIAVCPGGRACASVTWEEKGYIFNIVLRDSKEELLKIAESMISR